ncbi:MAG: single-stranded-DNA-specific exonuclease RecJ [candidate division SR1 bacterium]|nr:single-stranded-DNA-specific exonuclease RecJ [candidate division SR1 bacterium]
MNYHVIHDNPDEDLLTRLFKVRGIDDDIESFLDPKISDYRLDPFLLNDMDKAVDRIITAVKNKDKIMVFGDYDVDGVTSSYIMYEFITRFLKYKKVSIQYPDRIKEGYGIKKIHIDDMKKKGVNLIITVDNGIASLQEAIYAKQQGIDLIITDHHQDLESIPEAVAVVNPQVSPNYPFKGLAGVGVTFKLICALLSKSSFDQKERNHIFNYFLPIVTIGTVADVVPLIHENRVIVKKGLKLLNSRKHLPESLKGFLEFLNIKGTIETYHIGFIIGPRINAGGRIRSPYDSLYALLYSGEKQIEYLDNLELINTERRKIQENMFKEAEGMLDLSKRILVAYHEEFHEGIVGIVSGRLTEKYHKPSMIMKIDQERKLAVASLRGPEYFSIIDMLKANGDLLERFGGHRGAGGLTVKLEHLETIIQKFSEYCENIITDDHLIKSVKVDTKIYEHERNNETLENIEKFAPFGEGNKEPVFLLENVSINKIEKVGTRGKCHLKIHGTFGNKKMVSMFRGKGDEVEAFIKRHEAPVSLIGKIRKDTFNGGFYLEGADIE